MNAPNPPMVFLPHVSGVSTAREMKSTYRAEFWKRSLVAGSIMLSISRPLDGFCNDTVSFITPLNRYYLVSTSSDFLEGMSSTARISPISMYRWRVS